MTGVARAAPGAAASAVRARPCEDHAPATAALHVWPLPLNSSITEVAPRRRGSGRARAVPGSPSPPVSSDR
eukprot:2536136-Pyramimonas_sp.AAC.1